MELNSKIFVAGHNGMVGSAIVRKLKNEGYTNIITASHQELDLTNQSRTYNYFKNEKPDYVFLAAAKVGGIMANNLYPAEYIYQNLMIETNVINSCFNFDVKKLQDENMALHLKIDELEEKQKKKPRKEKVKRIEKQSDTGT